MQAQSVTPTVIDTPLYKITFSNRGGEVTSWILKKYKNLITGQPLDLVNHEAAAKFGYPLSIWTYQPALTRQLAGALYVPSSTSATLTAPTTLTFTYSANGLQVTKSFSFDDTYVMHAKVTVTQNGAPVTAGLAWPAGFGDQHTLPEYANADFNQSEDGKFDQTEYKKVSGGKTLTGNFNWAGVSDLYFAAICPARSSPELQLCHTARCGRCTGQHQEAEGRRNQAGVRAWRGCQCDQRHPRLSPFRWAENTAGAQCSERRKRRPQPRQDRQLWLHHRHRQARCSSSCAGSTRTCSRTGAGRSWC